MLNSFKILLSAVSCLLVYTLAKRWKYYKLHFQVGGVMGFPILGIVHRVLKRENIVKLLREVATTYGEIFLTWIGPLPSLIVSEPIIIQEILTSPHCVNKSILYKAIDDATGPGLFGMSDPLWSLHRKLLNPAFSHKVLLSFFTIFNQETNKLLKTFDSFLNNKMFDYISILQNFTINIAAHTTMGMSVLEDYEHEGALLHSYRNLMENMITMSLFPWNRIKIIRRILGTEKEYLKAKWMVHTFVRNLINKKNYVEANEENTAQNKNIFLNIALEQHKKGVFTLSDVEAEANVIILAAFETTANTIAYTLLMLAMHPEYQEQAFNEIQTLFPDKDCMDISYEATTQMVYLDMVINETMRILAPIPVVGREASAEFKLSNGIVIPKGLQIGINIFGLHRNKAIWGPNAETFNPDHFLPANLADKHPYAFIPFTKGTRNCIGWRYALLSSKIALAKLLRYYRFTTDGKLENFVFLGSITLKLKNYPQLQVHKRI